MELSSKELPLAISDLLKLNNYTTEIDVKIHGAQIDVVAKSVSDPFAPTLYIEATVSYVDNLKYALDNTKFSVIREVDRDAKCICISTSGFTADVKERAKASRVQTLLYTELFSLYEKFGNYIDLVKSNKSIIDLNSIYEEPTLDDSVGKDGATQWLTEWRDDPRTKSNWIVLLGEYGTGKTALTQVLQHRWLNDYIVQPSSPIPFRIELRVFVRQFDARTLIHHFLDHNKLGHLPIDFIFFLIRSRRIVLLLDGYDEMAQYLNVRERRECLRSLAELASEGAKGMLTSRPNFFTETEELKVFETLYRSISTSGMQIGKSDRAYIEKEVELDNLLDKYVLNKRERSLKDLSEAQTFNLVNRKLASDPDGQRVVIALLRRVFRESASGDHKSLSGKPVIISYLLELLDQLKGLPDQDDDGIAQITEWQVYKLIIDRLMLRDLQRGAVVNPVERRRFLQDLAIRLAKRDTPIATEEVFLEIIDHNFRTELRPLDGETRLIRRGELFEDLRSSATLTRESGGSETGWRFSHNSLREFLCCEYLIGHLKSIGQLPISLPISAPMVTFVAAQAEADILEQLSSINRLWASRAQFRDIGKYLALYYETLRAKANKSSGGLNSIISDLCPALSNWDNVRLEGITISSEFGDDFENLKGSDADFVDMAFQDIKFKQANFAGSTFDGVSFVDCDLSEAIFKDCVLSDCLFARSSVIGADFRGSGGLVGLNVMLNGKLTRLEGLSAIGYLAFNGAITNEIESFYKLRFHPKFPILYKICEKLCEQKNSQLRGLTQRGEAHADPGFSRDFVDMLKAKQFVQISSRNLVSTTATGRAIFIDTIKNELLAPELTSFLTSY